jgi:hypothetical protein
MMEHTEVVEMRGKVLKETRSPSIREVAITGRVNGLNGLARAVAVVTAFGLLMALWVSLWIPSAPVP